MQLSTSGDNKSPLQSHLLLNTEHVLGLESVIHVSCLFPSNHLKFGRLQRKLEVGMAAACKKRETFRPRTGQGACSFGPVLAICRNRLKNALVVFYLSEARDVSVFFFLLGNDYRTYSQTIISLPLQAEGWREWVMCGRMWTV